MSTWWARCHPVLYGTMQYRASGVWRITCVVRRRSGERSMPPCSAIERSRLESFHSVLHEPIQIT